MDITRKVDISNNLQAEKNRIVTRQQNTNVHVITTLDWWRTYCSFQFVLYSLNVIRFDWLLLVQKIIGAQHNGIRMML